MVTRLCLLILALTASCTTGPQGLEQHPEQHLEQQRQPLPMTPLFPVATGRVQGAMLGSSLGACRADGFVAGAPGDNSLLFVTDGGVWFDAPIAGLDAGAFAVAVACDGPAIAPRLVTAGDLGTWYWFALSWNLADGVSVEALEPGPLASSPLLLGSPATGSVSLQRASVTGYTWVTDIFPSQTAGSALVWDRAGTFFVVGDAQAATARFYGFDGDAGVTQGPLLSGPANSSFGAALAIGDVHPRPGAELIVGAPGSAQVFIYGGGSVPPALLMVLDADSPAISGSFGISLAIEPNAAGSLGALWVGDPLNDRVMRYVGDAGEPLAGGSNASYFGFSLAMRPRALIVGAPLYSDLFPSMGAIYRVPLDGVTLIGATMQCDRLSQCITPSCEIGTCVGGVLCVPTGELQCDQNSCDNGVCEQRDAGTTVDAGLIDAGIMDAGSAVDGGDEPDAGTAVDAGRPDAGQGDAGAQPPPDAGPPGPIVVTFGTCGCSGLGAVPLVLLSMLLGRRARRR